MHILWQISSGFSGFDYYLLDCSKLKYQLLSYFANEAICEPEVEIV